MTQALQRHIITVIIFIFLIISISKIMTSLQKSGSILPMSTQCHYKTVPNNTVSNNTVLIRYQPRRGCSTDWRNWHRPWRRLVAADTSEIWQCSLRWRILDTGGFDDAKTWTWHVSPTTLTHPVNIQLFYDHFPHLPKCHKGNLWRLTYVLPCGCCPWP